MATHGITHADASTNPHSHAYAIAHDNHKSTASICLQPIHLQNIYTHSRSYIIHQTCSHPRRRPRHRQGRSIFSPGRLDRWPTGNIIFLKQKFKYFGTEAQKQEIFDATN